MRSHSSRPHLILGAVCLAVFAINLDTTIVNVALPSLTRQLGATTHDLQWIVDGYNLAFAALVLAAGSVGDRFGRRPALLIGLVGFAATSAANTLHQPKCASSRPPLTGPTATPIPVTAPQTPIAFARSPRSV